MIEKNFKKITIKWFLITFTCVTFIIILIVFNYPKYKFGYFAHSINLKEVIWMNSTLQLDSNNIIITGRNDRPFIIVNLKNKTKKEFHINGLEQFEGNAILLDNNRLLLTKVNKPHKKYPHNYETIDGHTRPLPPFELDCMAVVNLSTQSVENFIEKRINKIYEPWIDSEILLDNKKVLITDFVNSKLEVYNIKTSTSKLLNIKMPHFQATTIIPTKDGKALIFGSNEINTKFDTEKVKGPLKDVFEYDDKTETIKPVGKVIRRYDPIVKKINDNQIIIMGGKIETNGLNTKVTEIELYDINTNTSKVIANLPEGRFYQSIKGNSFDGGMVDNKHFLIVGGVTGANYKQKYFMTPLILDLDTYQIHEIAKLPFPIVGEKIITLKEGGALILENGLTDHHGKTLAFKIWRKE